MFNSQRKRITVQDFNKHPVLYEFLNEDSESDERPQYIIHVIVIGQLMCDLSVSLCQLLIIYFVYEIDNIE